VTDPEVALPRRDGNEGARSVAPGRRSRRGKPRHAAEPARRRHRRLPPVERGTHRCLVLAYGPEDIAAVELRSGAFVRLRVDGGMEEQDGLLAFDVVDATWAEDPQRDDLAQPEAVSLSGPPVLVGSLRGRRARRLLKSLVAPPAQHLLGFAGSAAPYWEFHGMRPSVALVAPSRGPLLFRRRGDDSVWARFGWPGSDHWLPVEDRRALACLWASGRDRLSGRGLTGALGFRPSYLLITVSRPRQGHCYKTVAALLPRP
jgi:hypothetical protein